MRLTLVDKAFQVCNNWLESRNIHWLSEGSVGRRFASSSFWSFIGTFVSGSLGLVTTVFIARLLGQATYGELGILVSTLGMFSLFGNFGLGMTATTFVSRLRHTDPRAAGETAGFAIAAAVLTFGICSVALFFFSPVLSAKLLNAPHLVNALRLMSVTLFLGGVDGIQIGILSGFESFKVLARITLWRGLINMPLTIVATWLFGLIGTVYAMIIVSMITAGIKYVAIRRVTAEAGISIQYVFNRMQVKLLWKFSLPAFLYGVWSLPVTWIVNAILVNQPNGYLEMGLLNAANQWRSLANIMSNTLSTIGVAIQSNLIGNDEKASYRQMVSYNLLTQVLGTVMIVILIIILAPWIMRAYGKSFSSGNIVLILMSVGWVFMSVSSVLWDVMVSSGVIWMGFIFNLISGFVLLYFSWRMVSFGAKGIAIAYICSYGIAAVLQLIYFMKKWYREKEAEL